MRALAAAALRSASDDLFVLAIGAQVLAGRLDGEPERAAVRRG